MSCKKKKNVGKRTIKMIFQTVRTFVVKLGKLVKVPLVVLDASEFDRHRLVSSYIIYVYTYIL